jgi:hypothetical protein
VPDVALGTIKSILADSIEAFSLIEAKFVSRLIVFFDTWSDTFIVIAAHVSNVAQTAFIVDTQALSLWDSQFWVCPEGRFTITWRFAAISLEACSALAVGTQPDSWLPAGRNAVLVVIAERS